MWEGTWKNEEAYRELKPSAENYIDSLEKIVVDRPPSCHKPDIPGQGTKQRDQLLKLKPNVD